MDPRFREDDTGRGMDPRVREDDGKYIVMSAPLRRCCPLVIPAEPALDLIGVQDSIPVFFSTVKST